MQINKNQLKKPRVCPTILINTLDVNEILYDIYIHNDLLSVTIVLIKWTLIHDTDLRFRANSANRVNIIRGNVEAC